MTTDADRQAAREFVRGRTTTTDDPDLIEIDAYLAGLAAERERCARFIENAMMSRLDLVSSIRRGA